MNRTAVMLLNVDQLDPHPDNPRKDLGDLTELISSIKKNGVMQNLTVIPQDDEWTRFTVLIGHRRLAAAKEAGMSQVPCCIAEGIEKVEQIAIMLEENMQRNDLTMLEEAHSFQMMLDLGDTVQQICERTGVSETKVRGRLEIAKLDPGIIMKHQLEEDDYMQLSLGDYAKLSKIKDIRMRNKCLEAARDRRSLEWQINNAVEQEKYDETKAVIVPMLEKVGIKENTSKDMLRYRGDYEIVRQYELKEDPPKELGFVKTSGSEYKYEVGYGTLYVFRQKKSVGQTEKKSEDQLKRERIEKNRKLMGKKQADYERQRRSFILALIDGAFTMPDKEEIRKIEDDLWKLMMMKDSVWISLRAIAEYLIEGDWYEAGDEKREAAKSKARQISPLVQKLISVDRSFSRRTGTDSEHLVKHDGTIREELAEATGHLYDILEKLGFVTDPEIRRILAGNSELFEKGEDDAAKA